jgi:hypothetical protein
MDVGLGVTDYGNIIATVTGSPQGGGFGMAKIIAWVIFGAIGFVAFAYGKKSRSMRPMILGGILMIYPYFVSETWPLYIVGGIFTAALYYWRE